MKAAVQWLFLLALCPGLWGAELQESFDDDHSDPTIWNPQMTTKGDAYLAEQYGRLQLVVPSAGRDSEARQRLAHFHPRADQAWSVEFLALVWEEILSGEGASISMGVRLVDARNPGRFIEQMSGAKGGLEEVRDPYDDDTDTVYRRHADVRVNDEDGQSRNEDHRRNDTFYGPYLFGFRMAYDPADATVRLYHDFDADNNDGEWRLFRIFSLDGTEPVPNETYVRDWNLAPTDVLNLEVVGAAQRVNVNPDNVFIDDLVLRIEPLTFAAWTHEIGDPAKRAISDDASGNGIPNLMQYFYGLSPLDSRTDAGLRYRREGGKAYLLHAADFEITGVTETYEFRNALDDLNQWRPIAPLSYGFVFQDGIYHQKLELPPAASQGFYRVRVDTNP